MVSLHFDEIAEIEIDPDRALVYELGWQSWSPSGSYSFKSTSPRPFKKIWQAMAYRPEFVDPSNCFQSDGVLIVNPGDGRPIVSFGVADIQGEIPHILATPKGNKNLVISSNLPIEVRSWPSAVTIEEALSGWADSIVSEMELRPLKAIAPAWCSWYCYWFNVTQNDIIEALGAITKAQLPITTIQIDDGWQKAIGDWAISKRFGDLKSTIAAIKNAGKESGIWLAPFLVGANSQLAEKNPSWILDGADAGFNWNQPLLALDTTANGAMDYLLETFTMLKELGVTYFKLDFLYAGAMEGNRNREVPSEVAYRQAMASIRECVGDEATIVGCGAPILSSVGLVDAMRISPDISPLWDPPEQDLSQPGSRAAILNSRARRALHGRFWVNDPDCLLLRPSIENRELIADAVASTNGLRTFSDPISSLDDWAIAKVHELITPAETAPAVPSPRVASVKDISQPAQ